MTDSFGSSLLKTVLQFQKQPIPAENVSNCNAYRNKDSTPIKLSLMNVNVYRNN